ncbi:MAG: DUF1549 domain-containing protein [Pirellulales bacterium]
MPARLADDIVSRKFRAIARCAALAVLLLAGSFAANQASGAEENEGTVSFLHDVVPALTKAGCNQGACHGAASGKGGFRLSLRGYDPESDFVVLRRDELGRRIDLLSPSQSLILRKPTADVPHRGGKVFDPASPAYQVLLQWVTQGTPPPARGESKLVSLAIEPGELLLPPSQQTDLRVTAHYADGHERDVTIWCLFDSNESGVAVVDKSGHIRTLGPGKTAISAAYLDQVAAIEVTVPFPAPVEPRDYATLPRVNFIDDHAIEQWRKLNLWPSGPADDATFLRRLRLDLTGRLPEPAEVTTFLADTNPNKRDLLIEQLLASPEFVDHWVHRWSDVFRVSREWLGEKSVWTFHHYLRDRIGHNAPWDQVTHELVAGAGDSSREGPPNFYRLQKVYNEAELLPLTAAETTAQTFLGIRMQCARCHNHPFDRWTQNDYYGFVSFFAQVGMKQRDGQNVVIYDTGAGEISHPRLGRAMPAKALDGPVMQPPSRRPWDGANWVWDAPGAATLPLSVDQSQQPRYLRRTFELPGSPTSARLYVTADDSYRVLVNGQEVGGDKFWGTTEAYNVAGLLTSGSNVVAVQATNNVGPAGVIVWLGVTTSDGTLLAIGTDDQWRLSLTELPGWERLDFDDSAWVKAVVQGPANMGPWGLSPPPDSGIQPPAGVSRRQLLADWIIEPENPFFAHSTTNRLWRWLMGRGLVEPVDDLRPSNPATNGPLLDALSRDFVEHGYDLKHVMRTIVRSRAYQLASTPTAENRGDERFYSHALTKRMTAEELLDALGQVTGVREKFPGLPAGLLAQQLPDTKVPSPFLDTFGRPLRRVASCECERVQDPNLRQSLEMMNSPLVHARVTSDEGLVARQLATDATDEIIITEIYLRALGRPPSGKEQTAILSQWQDLAKASPADQIPTLRREFFEDLLWAIVNSKEFLFNH